jgi:hypothetical protein
VGRLDEHEKTAIERHLQGCPECRSLYDRWRLVEPPVGFAEAVMADLSRVVVLDPKGSQKESPLYRFQWWGAVAAVLLVGLVFWRPEKDWVAADRSFAWLGSSTASVNSPEGQGVMKGDRHE